MDNNSVQETVSKFKNYAKNYKGKFPKISVQTILEANSTIASLKPKTINEYFNLFSAYNLMNTYVKREYAIKEFKKNYYFKGHVANTLDYIVTNNVEGVLVKRDKNAVLVEIYGLQFSFHGVKYSKNLYEHFNQRNDSRWEGIRYQPVSLELYNLSKSLLKQNESNEEMSV